MEPRAAREGSTDMRSMVIPKGQVVNEERRVQGLVLLLVGSVGSLKRDSVQGGRGPVETVVLPCQNQDEHVERHEDSAQCRC